MLGNPRNRDVCAIIALRTILVRSRFHGRLRNGFLDEIGFALAIGGIGVSIAIFFATYLWRNMPKWAAIIGFGFGIFLCIGAIVCFVVIPSPAEPEVTARFAHPSSPMLVLDNEFAAIARDIKMVFAIWNADDLRTYVPGSSGDDPLPIRISTYDVLRPHTSSGGQGIFQNSINAGYIKKGDKLIGSIGVVCPTCTRGHSYFVYIIWGQGGWFTEISNSKEGGATVPKRMTPNDLKAYFSSIEQIPIVLRYPIAEMN